MTKLRIISRLWSHITDLRLYINGNGSKTLSQIEDEIDITEYLCRPFADMDDVEVEENKPENCEVCKWFHTCRSYYCGPGCKYN